jgi:hypothetical protein
MATTIDFHGTKATISEGTWVADEKGVAEVLTMFMPDQPPGPSEPDEDFWYAQQIIATLGGEVLESDPVPAGQPGRVY